MGEPARTLAPVSDAAVASGARVRSAIDRQREIAAEEHLSGVVRLRRSMTLGIVVWNAFGLVDLLVVAQFHVASYAFFLGQRVLVTLLFAAGILRLHRKPPPSPAVAMGVDLVAYTCAALSIGVMCIPFWGITSPYGPGVCLVVLHRTLGANYPWKRGLVMNGLPALSYPAVLLAAAVFDPRIAAQLHDARAVSISAIYLAFVLGTALLTVIGGHFVWQLRRQVFEARNVGKYKLKKPLGKGAMGEVWLAHHGALKRDVAVKILRHDADHEGQVSRFEREVHATSELSHPNTVRIYDYGATDDGLWYYAMELLEGETVAQLVAREGALPPARAIRLAAQAARALGEAHGRGIVHRDVKPENLFVTTLGGEQDFLKVLDFGIARFSRHEADPTLTGTGWVLGTPAYISPEAALGKETDARADVYSLGAVLYFMCSGAAPFEGTNAASVLVAHVHEKPARPSERTRSPLPQDLEDVVMRCLEKEPARRFADGTELAAALGACEDAAKWSATMAAGTKVSSRPPPSVARPDAPTLEAPGTAVGTRKG